MTCAAQLQVNAPLTGKTWERGWVLFFCEKKFDRTVGGTFYSFHDELLSKNIARRHARKPVSDPQTKIIGKQTLLISLFALYKIRNTYKQLLTGDQNTQYPMRQTFCLKCQLNVHYDKISRAMR